MSKKVILVKINELDISKGTISNLKIDLALNCEKLSLQNPIEDYARFEIAKTANIDNKLMITFSYMINKSHLQINKSEINISSKLLLKENQKTPSVDFVVEKPISRMIESNTEEIKVTSKFSILITVENSTRMKSFFEEMSTRKQNQAIPSKTYNPNYVIHNNNIDKAMSGQSFTANIDKSDQKDQKDLVDKNDLTANTEEEKPEEEDVIPEEEFNKKIKLKSEVLRQSLKIDYNDFSFNTACKRCNYLERLCKAQAKDIEVLQSQMDCFMNGNFSSANDKPFELESDYLLRAEPVYNKIFADVDTKLEKLEAATSRMSVTSQRSPRKSQGSYTGVEDKYKGSSSPGKKNPNYDPNRGKTMLQSPGKEVNVYMFDGDKKKTMEKYENEIDNLRGQTMSLIKEKKVLEVIRTENESLCVQISRSEKLRVQLEQKLIDNANNYQSKIENNLVEIERILKDKRTFEEKSQNLEISNQNLNFELIKNENKFKELEHSLNINKANVDVISNNNNTIFTLRDEFVKFEKSRVHQQEEFKRSLNELNGRLSNLKLDNDKLLKENNALYNKAKELEIILNVKTREIMEKQKKILDLETFVVTIQSENLNSQEVLRHRDELVVKFNRIMEINYNLNEDIAKLNKNFQDKFDVLKERIDITEKENQNQKSQSDKKQKEIQEKTNQINDAKMKMERMNLEITDLNSKKLYAFTTDEHNKILQDTIKSIFDFNSKIIKESNDLGDYVIGQADKSMTAQHYIRKLMRALLSKEAQLREYRKNMDNNKVAEYHYNPIKSCVYDMKLAELINSYPSKSRFTNNFVRESRATYSYGNKMLNVILDGSRFLINYQNSLFSFDEFVDKYA